MELEIWRNFPLFTKTNFSPNSGNSTPNTRMGLASRGKVTAFGQAKKLFFLTHVIIVLDLTEPDNAKWRIIEKFWCHITSSREIVSWKNATIKVIQSISDIPPFKNNLAKTYVALLNYYKVEDQMTNWFHLLLPWLIWGMHLIKRNYCSGMETLMWPPGFDRHMSSPISCPFVDTPNASQSSIWAPH